MDRNKQRRDTHAKLKAARAKKQASKYKDGKGKQRKEARDGR